MSTLPELSTAGPRPAAAPRPRGRLVVAGSGSIGRRHIGNLRRLDAADLVVYRTGRRDPHAPAVDGPEAFDLDRLLAGEPAAVLVCNPSALHVPVALAAARAGVHLFVEKPLSHSRDGIDALRAEVGRKGLVALVGFQYRFHPGLRRARQWLFDGAIGDPVTARVHWGEYLPDWHPGEDWRRSYAAREDLGGGAIRTLCHPFDYLRFQLGEVEAVSAFVSRRALGLDVEDAAHVALRFACGALASVELDYLQRPRAHGFELVGTRGRIRWSDADGAAHLHDARRDQVTPFFPAPGFTRNEMFLAELRHFLACIEGRERPACSLADGVRALEIALLALRSAEEGRQLRMGGAA
jgi:predicted dehydrogenase